MGTSLRFARSLPALGCVLALWLIGIRLTLADQPAGVAGGGAATGDGPAPQGNFLSTLSQAFKQDFDHQVVRGHFEVGSAPDAVHRYYCLVDAKTGKRQANGVAGEPFQRPDGMTGIKGTAVSLYSCAGIEQRGLLVTTEYVLVGGAAAQAAAPVPAQGGPTVPSPTVTASVTSLPSVPVPAAPAATSASMPYRVDVAGVKLGMSVEEVRSVLKSKKLLDYHESTQTLGHLDPANGAAAPAGAGFVNVVAAWTVPVDGGAGEAYEVMFTPVPGNERAMAIIHSVSYSRAHVVRAGALNGGLVKKYGGYTESAGLPVAPTWRFQSSGGVQVGDACKRRELFGGLADVGAVRADRPNLALKTTPEEFRYQIDLCGIAIVTEDHAASTDKAHPEDAAITRFTVTAYSPSIGFEGATAAAQAMQAVTGAATADKANPPHAEYVLTPDL